MKKICIDGYDYSSSTSSNKRRLVVVIVDESFIPLKDNEDSTIEPGDIVLKEKVDESLSDTSRS